MKVLISGEGFSVNDPESVAGAVIIGAQPVNFAIDFGPMLDSWDGGVAIADIAPVVEDNSLYRVTDFQDIPMWFRQGGENEIVLDSQDGTWSLSLIGTGEATTVDHFGRIPSVEEPGCGALSQFLLIFGVALPVQELLEPR